MTKKAFEKLVNKLKDTKEFPKSVLNSSVYSDMINNADYLLYLFDRKDTAKVVRMSVGEYECPDCGTPQSWGHEKDCPNTRNDNWS